ncbi:Radical SAM domain protein [Methanothermus fervidus DSM 2088]|uniref:Radical SAM domain protein n=1 Tax=Methanothermus fervidus (strain ATCC 43054 / DSM 2088 / JCM 10308 / V24 S) TaxID=523846 RepID=E3GXH8_METFV|nr:radical SAM protein [Methanothermus fervidus]ADP77010.1 Radical SAM domain protein [Methanothermus fervidus DSM 2088]
MLKKKTKSLCPKCLKTIDAEISEEDNRIIITKKCPEHGTFKNTYWSDSKLYEKFEKYEHVGDGIKNPQTNGKNCPQDCGLCQMHKSHTVLGLIDVTNRCNLRCPTCFANAATSGYLYEPSYEEIRKMLRLLRNNKPVPTPAIQYAGGEPTVRKDILELIKLAREEGFTHVQIATNGLKLGKDPSFPKKLRNAGLNTVYLQFDGVTSDPYITLRGKDLLPIKLDAIENCRKAGLGIVLVPTLVKGVNDHEIGDIIKFAIDNHDVIRGITFQPVSFTGRTHSNDVEEGRITIPDFMKLVEKQTEGMITVDDFYPASSVVPISELIEALEGEAQVKFTCHQHCGAATYIFIDDDEVVPITRFINVDEFFELMYKLKKDIEGKGVRGKAKAIGRLAFNLRKIMEMSKVPKSIDMKKLILSIFKERSYEALGDFHYKSLLISCMHFMDPWNFDIERVKRCIIHYATPDGRIIPFCSMNSIHREIIEKKFSKPLKK